MYLRYKRKIISSLIKGRIVYSTLFLKKYRMIFNINTFNIIKEEMYKKQN